MGGGGISDRSAAFAIWPHTLKPINSYRPQPRFCMLRNRGLFVGTAERRGSKMVKRMAD